MANFSPSNLVKAQAKLAQKFTAGEMRQKPWAGTLLALQNIEMILPSHNILRTREDRAVSAYFLSRTKRSTGTSRTHNHTGNRGDSVEKPLAWSTFTDKFKISLKQMDNNVFSWQEAFNQELLNSIINIHEDIETASINYLMANRTQINAATKGGSFNAATDAFEIAASNKQRFYQLLKSMMRQNKYNGTLDVIADSNMYVNAEFDGSQGSGNQTNFAFQFSGLNIIESIELEDADYADGTVLAMPTGQFGVLPWIPKQNREGRGDYNSVLGGYGSIQDPLGSGLQLAIHGYTERADTSGENGNSQDDVLQMEVSVDLSFNEAPLSVATESVIFQAGLVS